MAVTEGSAASCPVCGGSGHRTLGPNPDYPDSEIVRCSACGLMSTFPVPPQEELAEDYETSYVLHHHDELPPHYVPHKDARAAAQRSFVVEHSDLSVFDRVSVLDIGSGIGSLLKAFADLPNAGDLVGIEPSPTMRARAQQRVPPEARLLGGLFSPNRFEEASFELVTGSHVLEHVGDPVRFLGDVRSTVRPGGLLFLEVPRETEHEVRRIVAARHQGLMHLLFFERETLLAALHAAGWELCHVAAFGPSRDSFSVVPPSPRPSGSRIRRRAVRFARRLGLAKWRPRSAKRSTTSAEMGSIGAFSTENEPDGIWLRVLARNPAR
jgi:SAM-dependent methyltransferase